MENKLFDLIKGYSDRIVLLEFKQGRQFLHKVGKSTAMIKNKGII